jgi:hypothetical protein
MKTSGKMPESQLERFEEQLRGFKSYIKELKDRTTEYGTPDEQFADDLMEAEQNVKYYEGEIALIKEQLGTGGKTGDTETVVDTILPRTAKQGIGSFILTSIGFVAGALLASRLSSSRGSKDRPEEKEER